MSILIMKLNLHHLSLCTQIDYSNCEIDLHYICENPGHFKSSHFIGIVRQWNNLLFLIFREHVIILYWTKKWPLHEQH